MLLQSFRGPLPPPISQGCVVRPHPSISGARRSSILRGPLPPVSSQECVVRPHSVKPGAQRSFNFSWGTLPPSILQGCVVRPHPICGAQRPSSLQLSRGLPPYKFPRVCGTPPLCQTRSSVLLQSFRGPLPPPILQGCVVRPHPICGAQRPSSLQLSRGLPPYKFPRVCGTPPLCQTRSSVLLQSFRGPLPPPISQECVVRPHSVKSGAQRSPNLSWGTLPPSIL